MERVNELGKSVLKGPSGFSQSKKVKETFTYVCIRRVLLKMDNIFQKSQRKGLNVKGRWRLESNKMPILFTN